jgi:hypothetical protein
VIRFKRNKTPTGAKSSRCNITFDLIAGHSFEPAGMKRLKHLILKSGRLATAKLSQAFLDKAKLCRRQLRVLGLIAQALGPARPRQRRGRRGHPREGALTPTR